MKVKIRSNAFDLSGQEFWDAMAQVVENRHDHMWANISHHTYNELKCFGIHEQWKPLFSEFLK